MEDRYKILQEVIERRRTDKVLGDPNDPVTYSPALLADGDAKVKQAIRDAGFAPFHYDRNVDGLAEPWRVYWMGQASCQRLANELPGLIPDMKPGNKMPALLSGCGSLTLFTWLPQSPESAEDAKKLARVNREHLAATSAAVQNFLLLLTAVGMRNYWASGTLIADYLFDRLEISGEEILTAAVFADYSMSSELAGQGSKPTIVGGKNRQRRSPDCGWLKEISF